MNLRNGILTAVVVMCSFCELPQNPRTPENAGVESETLTTLPAEAAANAVYSCTISVRYPEFIDSFSLFQSIDGSESVKVDGASLDGDSAVVLSIYLPQPAEYDFTFLLYKTNGTDSVSTTISVYSTTPMVTVAESRRIVAPVDSVSFLFQVTDPDSNLVAYELNGGIFMRETSEFRASERAEATVSLTLPSQRISGLHDTTMVFAMAASDLSGQVSPAVLCTVTVRDTVPPAVSAVAPLGDTMYIVVTLPDTIRMTVSDLWRIDSVKYGGNRVVFASGDTVQVPLRDLDSGTTVDSLEAWDPAGNRTVKTVTLRYEGEKIYPPKITPFFQTVNERQQFDTVYLDDKVTITDTGATYGKDSLQWSVVVDTADSGMLVQFDSLNRTLFVETPTGEIHHDRIVVLTVTVTDPAGEITTLHGVTFLMVEKDDKPVITHTGQSRLFSVPFDTLLLDSCGYDPEGNSRLVWTIDRGTYFYPDSLYTVNCPRTSTGKEPIASCFLMFTGKVRIAPDTVAVATVPTTQSVIDTLRFSVKSITAGDTVEVSKYVQYIWSRLQIIPLDTGIIILPPLELR